jgi:RNA polymerase-binding transcription factor
MVMMTNLIRRRLLRRRRELLDRYRAELERADEELDEPQPEEIERATEQWDAQVLSRLSDADARALLEVVHALRRLEAGTYGTCTDCGGAIGSSRLDAVPTASTCIECAELADRPTLRYHAAR